MNENHADYERDYAGPGIPPRVNNAELEVKTHEHVDIPRGATMTGVTVYANRAAMLWLAYQCLGFAYACEGGESLGLHCDLEDFGGWIPFLNARVKLELVDNATIRQIRRNDHRCVRCTMERVAGELGPCPRCGYTDPGD